MSNYKPYTIDELLKTAQHGEFVELRGVFIQTSGRVYENFISRVYQRNSDTLYVRWQISRTDPDKKTIHHWEKTKQPLQIQGWYDLENAPRSVLAYRITPSERGQLSLVDRVEGGELSLTNEGALAVVEEEENE